MILESPPRATTSAILRKASELGFAVRIAMWAYVLPLLKKRLSLPRLGRLMWLEPTRPERDRRRERQIVSSVRRAYGVATFRRRDNCLEQSLLLYRYLSRAGARPLLVIGVRRLDRGGWTGHSWLLVDDVPIGVQDGYQAVSAIGRFGAIVPGFPDTPLHGAAAR